MGTNFYIKRDYGDNEWARESVGHIGKRSAAGLYCWDCGVSTGTHMAMVSGFGMHEISNRTCPKCGNTKALKEDLDNSAAGRELGFNKSTPMKKTGLASCSIFTWGMAPEALEGVDLIEDEYGREYTRAEFMQVLEECPLNNYDYLYGHYAGRVFS